MIARHRDAVVAGVLVLSTLVALVFAISARAAGEYEPNDSRETAAGPLAGGTDYVAGFETTNDVDWYVFYLKVYSQMDLSLGNTSGCTYGSADAELLDQDGKYVGYLNGGALNEVDHLRITLGAGRYYLSVVRDGCTGDRYKFRIDPAASVTPSRVCGEAIVAREAVGPELAKLTEKLGYVNAVVAKRTDRVKAAKRKLKRLKAKRAPRYSKRRARRQLTAAKVSLATSQEKQLALATLGGQYTAGLNNANAQIAGSC